MSEASLSGNLLEPSKDSDVAVSYDVTHNFADAQTSTKLVASTKVNGNTLSAELDGGLSEISAERDLVHSASRAPGSGQCPAVTRRSFRHLRCSR